MQHRGGRPLPVTRGVPEEQVVLVGDDHPDVGVRRPTLHLLEVLDHDAGVGLPAEEKEVARTERRAHRLVVGRRFLGEGAHVDLRQLAGVTPVVASSS